LKDFIKNFEREPGGAWNCVTPAEITTIMGRIRVAPGTRFTPGTVFMAVDIVRLLEESYNGRVRPLTSDSLLRHPA
jgi:hypothetical protein